MTLGCDSSFGPSRSESGGSLAGVRMKSACGPAPEGGGAAVVIAMRTSKPLANSIQGSRDLPECGLQSALAAAQQPSMRTEVRTPAGLRRLSVNSRTAKSLGSVPEW